MRKAVESVLEIKEDVRIGDVILEAGDQIRVLNERSSIVQQCMDYLFDDDGLDILPDTCETVEEALDELVEMFAIQGRDRDDILSSRELRELLEESGRFEE